MRRLKLPGQQKRRELRRQEWQCLMLKDLKDIYKAYHATPCACTVAVMWNDGSVSSRHRGGSCDLIGLIENAKIQLVNSLLRPEDNRPEEETKT